MVDGEVRIEPALPADAEAVGSILASAFPDKLGRILGDGGAAVLRDAYRRAPRALQGTLLAWVGTQAAGVIQLGPPAHLVGSARAFLLAARTRYGWLGAWKRLLQTSVLEVPDGARPHELYIRALAVRAGFQGHGVGTRLLGEAAVEARARRRTALSLLVLAHNRRAIRVYERFGFELGPVRRSRALAWATGHAGYHKMVKSV